MNDRDIFIQAPEALSPEELEAYIREACQGDATLESRVRGLFAASDAAAGFLGIPPVDESSADMAAVEEGTMIGHYKILQEIGRGGFGTVYMADQLQPVKRRVALKIIKLGMDTKEVIARFEAERQALAMMDHPNIAKVLDAGATDQGRPYFVMELVRGVPITRFCQEASLTVPERLRLFLDVCRAVQHAHQKGVIHRDLKPSNVMVTLHDDKPVPKVIDFGVAKATQTPLTDKTLFTRYEMFIGTPAYMSPEQAQISGLDMDTRSDIYALGVLLYELLSGRTPFDSQELAKAGHDEIRRKIKEEEPQRLSTCVSTMKPVDLTKLAESFRTEPQRLRAAVKGDLDWIVMKAIEKDRTRRYETANAFATDLERHLADEPVVARPPSVYYRFQKFSRKYRVTMIVAAAITAITILGLTGIVWQWRRAIQSATLAESNAEKASQSEKLAQTKAQEVETALSASLFNEGKAWLESARYYTDRPGEELYAALMAGRAIGYQGFGRESKPDSFAETYPVLISPEHPEYHEAYLLIANHRNAARPVWRTPATRHHRAGILCIDYSADGQLMASGSEDTTLIIWDAISGEKIRTLAGHQLGVTAVAFCNNSKWLVTASKDGTIIVWDAKQGKRLKTLREHTTAVTAISFSPDGESFVSCGEDGTLLLRDGQLQENPIRISQPNESNVRAIAFTPDSQTLASGSSDHQVYVWDLATVRNIATESAREINVESIGNQLILQGKPTKALIGRVLQGHWGSVECLVFSSDGKTLASGGEDRNISLWDWRTGALHRLPQQRDEVHALAFDTNGTLLAIACDQSLMVYNVSENKVHARVKDAHDDPISALKVHPNGGAFVSASMDMTIEKWSFQDLESAKRPPKHGDAITSVALSHSGKMAVTGDGSGQIILWDLTTGSRIPHFQPRRGHLKCLAFSPDDKIIAGSNWGRTTKLWDVETGKQLPNLKSYDDAGFQCVFSPDGTFLAAASHDRTAYLWNLRTGQLFQSPAVHENRITCLAFGPDGKTLAMGSADNTVIVWDLEIGDKRDSVTFHARSPFSGHTHWIESLAFSPNGKWLASGSNDDSILLWDLSSGQYRYHLKGHRGNVKRMEFSPDSSQLASVCDGHLIILWDPLSGKKIQQLPGHNDWITGLDFSPDGKSIICGGKDRTTAVHHLGDQPRTITELNASAQAIAFSPDHKTLASGGDDHRIILWDLDSNLKKRILSGHKDRIWSVAFSPDGHTLASACEDHTIILWDVKSGNHLKTLTGHKAGVLDLAFKVNGSLLVSGSKDQSVKIWNTETGRTTLTLTGHTGWVRGVAISNDGTVASASEDKTIKLWQSDDGSLIRTLRGHQDWVISLAFSPDGQQLASSSYDQTVRIWGIETNAAGVIFNDLHDVFTPENDNWILDVAFSPDGRAIAGAGLRGMVRIWDAESLGLLKTFKGHQASVEAVAFSPDGKALASGSRDRTIKIWPYETGPIDLAAYLSEGWLTLEGSQVRWPVVANNLNHEWTFNHLNVSESSHLGILRRGQSERNINEELFWTYFRARSWSGALAMLPFLEEPDSRARAKQALTQWLSESRDMSRLTDGVIEMRQEQLADLGVSLPTPSPRDDTNDITPNLGANAIQLAGRWSQSNRDGELKIEQEGDKISVELIHGPKAIDKASGTIHGNSLTLLYDDLYHGISRRKETIQIEHGPPMVLRGSEIYWRQLHAE